MTVPTLVILKTTATKLRAGSSQAGNQTVYLTSSSKASPTDTALYRRTDKPILYARNIGGSSNRTREAAVRTPSSKDSQFLLPRPNPFVKK